MPEQNGQSDTSPARDLDAFEAKLAAAKARRERTSGKVEEKDNTLLGMAWRLSTELLASVMVGMFLGWGADTLFGTRPWGLLIGLGLGIAAGFMSVFRTAERMEASTAHIPKGDDLPDDPADDDL